MGARRTAGTLALPALAMLAGACGSKAAAPASREVTGTLVIGGATVTVTKCRPDHGLSTYVVLENAKGAVRFEDKRMYWNPDDTEGFTGGHPLDCTRLDRSWGGGVRADGTAYFRGTLAFDCAYTGGGAGAGKATKITGDLTVDCGNITAEERAQLDGHRKDLRDEQHRDAPAPAP